MPSTQASNAGGWRSDYNILSWGGAYAGQVIELAKGIANQMTADPHTCVESDTVEHVMETMTRGRFRHVPVLDEGDRLCGMVSIGDVVKTRIDETVREAAALRDYISATA